MRSHGAQSSDLRLGCWKSHVPIFFQQQKMKDAYMKDAYNDIYIYIYVSKSREKPYGKTHTRQHPSAAKALFCSVIGVPVCATLACWQVSSMFQSKSVWSLQMDQIPANPKGDIWKGPKPKVNGSRRIFKDQPMFPPPVGDVISLVAGSLRASSFQGGSCHFLGL